MLSAQETRRKSHNHFPVVVTSMDAELEFNIHVRYIIYVYYNI